MNEFYINKVKNLRNPKPATVRDPLVKIKDLMENNQCSFKINKVTVEEVLKFIQGLKNSSATGTDFIDTRTIKLAANLTHHQPVHQHQKLS